MQYKIVNEEVYYTNGGIVEINRDDMNLLKQKAEINQRKRIRFCAHRGIDHPLHEMFIIHHKGVYVRPHQHFNKTESFHVIHGDVDIILFKNDGSIMQVLQMGSYRSGKTFFCRLPEKCFHTMMVNSDNLMIQEITGGPFVREQTAFASWAPEESDNSGIDIYMSTLSENVKTFLKNSNG